MRKILPLLTVLLISGSATAQNDVLDKKEREAAEKEMRKLELDKDTTYLNKGGVFGFNASQISLTNWAGGGESSLSGTALLSLFSNYRNNRSQWDNTLDLAYGLVRQNGITFKSDDKIDFASKYGYRAFDHVYYTTLVTFRSQFAPGFTNPTDTVRISNFLAPAYTIASLGLDWKPNEHFTAFVAPVTGKLTIVNDQMLADAGAFGVEEAVYDTSGNKIVDGKRARMEFGGYIKLAFSMDVVENVKVTSRLDLFSNYLVDPQNIDVNWETLVAMKVNKWLTVNFSTHLIYDHDIDIAVDSNDDGVTDYSAPRTQFKQVLSVGFSYKF